MEPEAWYGVEKPPPLTGVTQPEAEAWLKLLF